MIECESCFPMKDSTTVVTSEKICATSAVVLPILHGLTSPTSAGEENTGQDGVH